MTYFLVNLLLALLWASLNQFLPIDLVSGFVIGYLLVFFSREWLGEEARVYSRRMPMFLAFLAYYLKQLVVATIDVTLALFRDQSTLRPGIIQVPLDAKTDFEIVMFNNLLMLTPGSIGVHLSADHSTLYVHVIDVPNPEETVAKIKNGLERRLLDVLR